VIIPTTVSSVTKAEQHGFAELQGFCARSQFYPAAQRLETKNQSLINLFIAQVCAGSSAIIMLVSLFRVVFIFVTSHGLLYRPHLMYIALFRLSDHSVI
jgi:hypothetical protein